jgi:hypothetical protein
METIVVHFIHVGVSLCMLWVMCRLCCYAREMLEERIAKQK